MDDSNGPPTNEREEELKIEVHAETMEVTVEQFLGGLTVFGSHFGGHSTKLVDAVREIYVLPWDSWTPTVAVTQIMLTTQPAPGAHPPQSVSSSVNVMGFGFRPGVPVRLKWNNAWGFPGTSIPLPDGLPDSRGRFALVLQHTTIQKPGKNWIWEQQNQLVLVAQQLRANGSIEHQADYRPVPPHVLWKWVP